MIMNKLGKLFSEAVNLSFNISIKKSFINDLNFQTKYNRVRYKYRIKGVSESKKYNLSKGK